MMNRTKMNHGYQTYKTNVYRPYKNEPNNYEYDSFTPYHTKRNWTEVHDGNKTSEYKNTRVNELAHSYSHTSNHMHKPRALGIRYIRKDQNLMSQTKEAEVSVDIKNDSEGSQLERAETPQTYRRGPGTDQNV